MDSDMFLIAGVCNTALSIMRLAATAPECQMVGLLFSRSMNFRPMCSKLYKV